MAQLDNKIGQDTALPTAQHKLDVIAAMESEAETAAPGAGAQGSSADDALANDMIMSQFAGPVVTGVVGLREELKPQNKAQTVNGPQHQQRSSFANLPLQPAQAARSQPVTMMPKDSMTYPERVAAGKAAKKAATPGARARRQRDGNIFAAATLAGDSLTGSSSTSGDKKKPAKGVAMTPDAARALGVSNALITELAATNQTIDNPYGQGTKRLEDDLRKGAPAAEEAVQKKPELLKPPS